MIRLLATAVAVLTASPAAAALIVANANGYTLDGAGKLVRFTAMTVGDDGRVLGTHAAAPAGTAGDRRLDAGGRTLLPGLIDAHGHVMGLGRQALAIDLNGTASRAAALKAIAAHVVANPGTGWITGGGWNQERWPDKAFPRAADLAAVAGGRPVYLERVDGHAAWVDATALKAAGITAATPDPAGGLIERDAMGNATGILIDAAMGLVERVIPPPTPEQSGRALDKAMALLASVGLTQVADMGVSPADWALYRRYDGEGRLTLRIAGYAAGMAALGQIAPDGPLRWSGMERLAMNGVKLYGDGALGSRGAWLKADYADAPGNRGLRFNTDAELRAAVAKADAQGFDIAVHAIGDAANTQALDAFAAPPTERVSRGNLRRIEHAQVVASADLARFKGLGVIASMQPTHATSDKDMAEARVGEARLAGGYAWATLLKTGAAYAAGSDFPVEPANPFFGLHAAVTRQDRDGTPRGGWRKSQALTFQQAFAAFTTGAASANAAPRTGTLAKGQWADFILVDRDPFRIAPADLWRVQVDETWLAGQRVFKR